MAASDYFVKNDVMEMKTLNKNIVWFVIIVVIVFTGIHFFTPPLKELTHNTTRFFSPNQHNSIKPSPEELTHNNIGFFSPLHLDSFVSHVNFSMINLYPFYDNEKGGLRINIDSLKKNLDYVTKIDHRVHLDLGPVITDLKESETINTHYENSQGEKISKKLKLKSSHKIRDIISDEEIEQRLFGLTNILKTYRDNVGVIFIVDEPYLNGISKDEIDRAIRTLKRLFKKNGIDGLEFGVIFASGLFDPQFAKHINRHMMKYVEGIDQYYQSHQSKLKNGGAKAEESKKLIDSITKNRLTTYDSANNIYMEGGIPTELDVVAFDFYLSTLLFDQIHEETLHYFSTSLGVKSCQPFTHKTLSSIRNELSFIQDGPIATEPDAYKNDKALLDAIFDCRMAGSMTLLDKTLHTLPKQPKLMLIGESSANGVLEFDNQGRIEPDQPELLVEQRILDEVKRSYHYYDKNRNRFDNGLMYFLYPDSFDTSINLFIRGAEGVKSVTDFIYSRTTPPAKYQTQPLDSKPADKQWLNPFVFKAITTTKQKLLTQVDTEYVIPLLNKTNENKLKLKKAELTVTSSAPDTVLARIENGHLYLRYTPPGAGKVNIDVHLKSGQYEEFNQIKINILE